MDVLIGFALGTEVEGEQDCVVRLLEALAQSRRKQANKLHSLNVAIGPRLRRRLKRSSSRLDKTLADPQRAKSGSSPNGPAEAMGRAIALSQELKRPARLNKNNLHPYRLKIKELRYTLQLAERAEQRGFVGALGDVKDAIGEWHDWAELVEIASDVLDHGAKCKLMAKLRAAGEARYSKALSLANHLRQAFLVPEASARSHSGGRKVRVVRQPVLAATSAIFA